MPARVQSANPRQAVPDQADQVRRDHEAIARLADDLLPALIAKLAASGLGEIEIRQGGWKARLRMPVAVDDSRRTAGKVAEGTHGLAAGRGPGSHLREERDRLQGPGGPVEEQSRIAAKSPAVGLYQPRRDLAVGMRVRAGDRIGSVNVLGVNQDVVSPVDGIIGSSLAEAGEAVEYGQELVRIELPERSVDAASGISERELAGVAGNA